MSQQADDNIVDAIISAYSDGLIVVLGKTENHGIEQVFSPLQTSGMTGTKQCNFHIAFHQGIIKKPHTLFSLRFHHQE